jgi:hypothetical protein
MGALTGAGGMMTAGRVRGAPQQFGPGQRLSL